MPVLHPSVFGQVADSGGGRLARRTQRQLLAVELDPALADRIGGEHRAGEFGPACADQAGEPEDLAGVHLERAVGQGAGTCNARRAQDDVAESDSDFG